MAERKEWLLKLCSEYLTDAGSSARHTLSLDDRDRIMESANRHGIAPLLYYSLAKSDYEIPPEVLDQLKKRYYLNTVRNEFYHNEMNFVFSAFREKGIEIIVLKGAALAETIYPERGLRPFSDIDLMVRKEGLIKAEDTLKELGYTLDTYATQRSFCERFDYHLRYIRQASIIELHWDLGMGAGIYKYMNFGVEALWNNARISRIAGIDVLIPSPDNLLIHSCIHSAKHKYSRLIWLYDIRKIIENYPIDWEDLVRNAKSDRIARAVFYGLYFTEELLGPIIPPHVLDELKPPAVEISLFKFLIYPESSSIFNIGYDMFLRLLLIDRKIDRIELLVTYPSESLSYLLFRSKKRTIRRLREGNVGL